MVAQILIDKEGVHAWRIKPCEEHAHHDDQIHALFPPRAVCFLYACLAFGIVFETSAEVAIVVLKSLAIDGEGGAKHAVVVVDGLHEKLLGRGVHLGGVERFVHDVALSTLLFVGRKTEDGGDAQIHASRCHLSFQLVIVETSRLHTAHRQHGIETLHARHHAVGLVFEILEDVGRDFGNAARVHQCGLHIGIGELFKVVHTLCHAIGWHARGGCIGSKKSIVLGKISDIFSSSSDIFGKISDVRSIFSHIFSSSSDVFSSILSTSRSSHSIHCRGLSRHRIARREEHRHRAHLIVVHFELEHLVVADGIGDLVAVEERTKHGCRGFSLLESIFGEDGCAGEAKLIVVAEARLQIFLGFAKL